MVDHGLLGITRIPFRIVCIVVEVFCSVFMICCENESVTCIGFEGDYWGGVGVFFLLVSE